MREHMGLFRGKRTDNKQWVEGYIVFEGEHNPSPYIVNRRGKYRVAHNTVGECTGLSDKNGKLIFEGDVCQIKNHRLITDLPFVIEWEDFAYNGWTWRDLDENGAVDSFTKGAAKFSEIIGNVHDNPELIGGEA